MRLAEFDYELPPDRIAQTPIEPRDRARLLVDRGSEPPLDAHVTDLASFLKDGDVLVVNDTKVLPSRLRLRRASSGAVEILLLEPRDETHRTWEAMARPARKLRRGETLFDAGGTAVVEVGERLDDGLLEVTVSGEGDPLHTVARVGEMPLPPYITAPLEDPQRYQTVFAERPASAAAPTAGLHLTPALLGEIEDRGVTVARVELVVGLDTFRPVSVDDPRQHPIHTEAYSVPAATRQALTAARRVVAVGTTAVRALESAAATGRSRGRTALFIHRPYQWRVVDVLMTNFHLPRTTLLMMIDAFVGPRWRQLYATALERGYRFLSFGDAMLLDRRAA